MKIYTFCCTAFDSLSCFERTILATLCESEMESIAGVFLLVLRLPPTRAPVSFWSCSRTIGSGTKSKIAKRCWEMLLIRSIVCLSAFAFACLCMHRCHRRIHPHRRTYMEKLSQVSRKVKWIHSRAELVPESLLCSAA